MYIRNINIGAILFILFVAGCATTPPTMTQSGPVAWAPKMHVGDQWETKQKGAVYHFKVIAAEKDGNFVLERTTKGKDDLYHYYYNSEFLLEKVTNLATGKTTIKEKPLRKWIDFPLFVGKKWKTKYRGVSISGIKYDYNDTLTVVGYETVETEAGSFKAFKIKRYNYYKDNAGYSGGPYTTYFWYSPEINNEVKIYSRYQKESEIRQLISYKPAGKESPHQSEKNLAKKSAKTPGPDVGTKKETIHSQGAPDKPSSPIDPQQTTHQPQPDKNPNDPPQIIITSPQSVMTRTETTHLNIAGLATSNIGISEVIINGVNADLGRDGHFSTDVPLNIGKNFIRIVAIDNRKLASQKKITITRITTAQNSDSQERKLALVIGNADYIHGEGLANPVNDAKAIASTLKKLDFEVMLRKDLSQRDMKKAIDQFGRKLNEHDVGLFFYAGHGVQVNGTNYLVPVDANIGSKNDVEYDCVSAGRVLAKMEDAGCKTNIVILDACRDNPFERRWTRKTRGSGLAFMSAPSGSLIAYATSPGSTALDGSGKNGLYTTALLENMTIPKISILEMFQRVRITVMKKSNERQIPWESTSLRGNFYFSTK